MNEYQKNQDLQELSPIDRIASEYIRPDYPSSLTVEKAREDAKKYIIYEYATIEMNKGSVEDLDTALLRAITEMG